MLNDARARILLVDDRPENLIALRSVLDELDAELVIASSGTEALKKLLDEDFSVILLDVQMPGIDGFETATLIRARERSRHTPIIFLTAINKANMHVFKGYSLGALDYVFKPFDPDILRAKVAAFVEMSRNVQLLKDEVLHRRKTEAELDTSNSLLEIMSEGMMRYIAGGAIGDAFGLMLRGLLNLTGSEYGFIAEIHGQTHRFHMRLFAEADADYNPAEGRQPGTTLSSLVDQRAICRHLHADRRAFIVNDPAQIPIRKGTSKAAVQITSLLALPIFSGEHLIGAACIANRPGGYDEVISTLLGPFSNTCAGIIFGYRNAARRQQAEDEIRELNEALEGRVADRTTELQTANRDLIVEVAERKKAELVLAGKQSHIEHLNEQLRQSMRETDHRVKNNLQIIAAMLDMRLMDDVESIPSEEIQRLGVHVRTLAAVHDLLTKEAQEDGQTHCLSSRTILGELLPLLSDTAEGRPICFEIADLQLTARQGTSLALVVNELVSNALKHGAGRIDVHLLVTPSEAVLSVQDDGPGFPAGFDPVRQAHTGLELIQHLSRWDLRGQADYSNRAEGGAEVRITIPIGDTPIIDSEI